MHAPFVLLGTRFFFWRVSGLLVCLDKGKKYSICHQHAILLSLRHQLARCPKSMIPTQQIMDVIPTINTTVAARCPHDRLPTLTAGPVARTTSAISNSSSSRCTTPSNRWGTTCTSSRPRPKRRDGTLERRSLFPSQT